MGNHRIALQGTRRESLLLSCRSASHGQLPAFLAKPFGFTLLSKNASANHLESHSSKNKGLKVPCFHTLTKNIGGRAVPISQPGLSPVTDHLRPAASARIVPRMSSEALISVRDLAKHFRTFKRREGLRGGFINLFHRDYQTLKAVDGISFQIARGEMVGYIGPNGAGKSTSIKMLTGILVPTSPQVRSNRFVTCRQRAANDRYGTPVLLTTHDLDDIEELCRRIMIIDHGRLLYDGPLAELKEKLLRTKQIKFVLRDGEQARALRDFEDLLAHAPQGKSLRLERLDEMTCRIRFDRSRISTSDLIRQILAAVEVRDLLIEDEPIDGLVSRINAGKAS